MKNRSNLLVLIFAVTLGSSFEVMHAQEQVDPWLQAFVKSLKKDDLVKTNGIKVGALRGAVPINYLALTTLLLSLPCAGATGLVLQDQFRHPNHGFIAPGFAPMAFIASVAVLMGSVAALIGRSAASSGTLSKKPYIIFDEKGLVIDNKRVFEWSDIESVELEKFPLCVCCTDQFGNDIKITSAELAALPLTAKNIVALAKHYIAKAKVAEDQKFDQDATTS